MKEVGIAVNKDEIKIFFAQIEGKEVTTLVKDGKDKLISMPAIGGGGAAAAKGPAAAAAPVEEKKEEVEDVDMGGLFGDDDGY